MGTGTVNRVLYGRAESPWVGLELPWVGLELPWDILMKSGPRSTSRLCSVRAAQEVNLRGGEERRGRGGEEGEERRGEDVMFRKRKLLFIETKASRRGGSSLFLEKKKTHFGAN
ncbi:hypothetical protein N1851_017733 [Merluccius polli]|uniref:Uncharacterized protein n=1 Tax=Merluccius polli TaxID=89951 RepID=A0AA47P1X2_MERPO|nr:hypothetical protein N1851_017733 [Merluccius polli]